MNVCSHKPHGYCGSSAHKTETKTNTKNCGGGTNFSTVLNKSVSCCKSSPKPHHVHGGSHSGHVSSSHGKHAHSHNTIHTASAPVKHASPHFGHAALHKGHSLLNSKSCSITKPVISSSTCGANAAAKKPPQLTVQSQKSLSINVSSYSYSVANAVSSSLSSLAAVSGMFSLMDAVKNKMNDDDYMLSFYKMLMKNFIEDKSEGAVSLNGLYVKNGKIMGLPPRLDKIINSIQTAQSTNANEKPDDAKSVLKMILKKGVNNIPDLTINIVMKKENTLTL
ncbi:MAG: hypothetical protein LBB56_02785 [Chitinispirillales bacterium]|jgi:hypothetical protein|nr:hypothetical protein [Chitinispirillales bacterium]